VESCALVLNQPQHNKNFSLTLMLFPRSNFIEIRHNKCTFTSLFLRVYPHAEIIMKHTYSLLAVILLLFLDFSAVVGQEICEGLFSLFSDFAQHGTRYMTIECSTMEILDILVHYKSFISSLVSRKTTRRCKLFQQRKVLDIRRRRIQ
jgi:hypothetical protein